MAVAASNVVRFGRPSKSRLAALIERAELAEAELMARHNEAIEFINGIRPLIAQLVPGAHELGPRHYQTVINALARLGRYETQQFPDPDDEGAAA